jgi:hypothetical protein
MRDTLLVTDKEFHDIAWTKRFWSDYYWQTPCIDGEYHELAFQPLEFAITDALSLTLHTDAQLSQVTLGLLHPAFESVQPLGSRMRCAGLSSSPFWIVSPGAARRWKPICRYFCSTALRPS